MAQHEEHAAVDDQGSRAQKRKLHWTLRLLRFSLLFTLVLLIANLLIGRLYRGPRDIVGVVMVMPGVPIFPLSQISPANARVQHAMALPLWIMRYQGAARAEAAQLQAPADDFFIADWYRRLAPTQGWSYLGQQAIGSGTRIIFTRKREGLQITIGITKDLFTPYQLVYLQGMTDRQQQQIARGLIRETAPAPAPVTTAKPAPAPQPAAGDPAPVPAPQPSTGTPTLTPAQPPVPRAGAQPPSSVQPSPTPRKVKPPRTDRNHRVQQRPTRPPRQRTSRVQPRDTGKRSDRTTVPRTKKTEPKYTKPIYRKSEKKTDTKPRPAPSPAPAPPVDGAAGNE